MKKYELLLALPGTLDEKEAKKRSEEVFGLVKEFDAEAVLTTLGKTRLAYPIKQIRYGYFYTIVFGVEPDALKNLQTKLGLARDLLRAVISEYNEKFTNSQKISYTTNTLGVTMVGEAAAEEIKSMVESETAEPLKEEILDLRDAIEKFLIEKCFEQKQTVVLVIDEAQQLNLSTLETLRILLNFETNEHKLIQLVLMGQLELYSKVVHMSNFMDRISFKFTLNPLDVKETGGLINFRINKAGYRGTTKLFLDEAISEVYNFTKGYPRKINMLCHKVLKELVIQDQKIIDAAFVKDVIAKETQWLSATKDLNFVPSKT